MAAGYVEHSLFHAPGAALRLPPAGFAYLGWLVAAGPTPAAAAAGLTHCAAAFRFDIAPLPAGPPAGAGADRAAPAGAMVGGNWMRPAATEAAG